MTTPVGRNQRHAGVAIEGALRQKIAELQSVAVDTHVFTHFALAAAKLFGFDLLPRLANLADRKLYLPPGLKVPAELEAMVSRVKITFMARRRWDGLLHLSASLKMGYGSAVTILDRMAAPHRAPRFSNAAPWSARWCAACSSSTI